MPDVNLLVAMADTQHQHHALAQKWKLENPQFATCAITELGLIRILIATGSRIDEAFVHLSSIVQQNRATFIPCGESASIISGKISGHKQVTDTYLLELARKHQLTLTTLDGGIKGAELVS